MMNYRSFKFMKPGCRVLRANYMLDVTNLRDPILTDYGIVRDRLNYLMEPIGSDVLPNEFVGKIAVNAYTIYLPGNAPVQENDILLIGGEYYDVGSVTNHGINGWEMSATITKKNEQRS